MTPLFDRMKRLWQRPVQPLAGEDPAIAEILAFIAQGKHRALCLPADDGKH